MLRSSVRWVAFALACVLVLDLLEAQPTERESPVTPSVIPAPIPTGKTALVKGEVPQAILESILKRQRPCPRLIVSNL
jgi:hypothetical protein